MDISFEFVDGVLVMRLNGHYRLDEWFDALDAALAHPDCPRPAPLLCVLSQSESVASRSPEEVRESALFVGERGARLGYRAAVVAPTDVQYGLMRMAEALIDPFGVEMRVVRTEPDAWAWLEGGESLSMPPSEFSA